MSKQWRKWLAGALTASLMVSALTACSSTKETTLDGEADYITLEDGGTITAGVANLMLRYEQAAFESGWGSFIKSYYGELWTADLTGTGTEYGETFKEEIIETLEHMLLDEAHMEDLGIEITDEEEAAIEEAAQTFLDENAGSDEVLEKMSATKENVITLLRYYTIQHKAEEAMTADVDTYVSDEEAAQRTVSYIYFTASTESEEDEAGEAVSEAVTEAAEAASESTLEEAGAAETAADVEEESDVKTESAEAATEGEESVAESAEGVTEAVTEAATEEETETESAEMQAARAKALAQAEAFLASAAQVEDGDAFDEAASAAADENDNAYSGSYTFGADDTYPDSAVIEATEGLDDNTLVSQVIVSGTSYYVLYVTDAFDEEATEEEKESIVEERKDDAISEQYETWLADAVIDVDGEISSQLLFDFSLTEEEETEDDLEILTEDATESLSEGESEDVAESAG